MRRSRLLQFMRIELQEMMFSLAAQNDNHLLYRLWQVSKFMTKVALC